MAIHARIRDLGDCVASDSSVTDAVVVDTDACHNLSVFLKSRTVPADREDSSLSGFSAREVGNFYLLLVALCHQTSPRGKKPLEGTIAGRRVKGWDYLSGKLETAARVERTILSPEYWAHITEEDVSALSETRVWASA